MNLYSFIKDLAIDLLKQASPHIINFFKTPKLYRIISVIGFIIAIGAIFLSALLYKHFERLNIEMQKSHDNNMLQLQNKHSTDIQKLRIEINNKFEDQLPGRLDSLNRHLPPRLKRMHIKCKLDNAIATMIFYQSGEEFRALLVNSVWKEGNNKLKLCSEEKATCYNEAVNDMNATNCKSIIEDIADKPDGCDRVRIDKFFNCNELLDRLEKLEEKSKMVYVCVLATPSKNNYYAVGFFGVNSNSTCDHDDLHNHAKDIFKLLKKS